MWKKRRLHSEIICFARGYRLSECSMFRTCRQVLPPRSRTPRMAFNSSSEKPISSAHRMSFTRCTEAACQISRSNVTRDQSETPYSMHQRESDRENQVSAMSALSLLEVG